MVHSMYTHMCKDRYTLALILYLKKFFCLFLAVLDLHCCSGFPLVGASGGYSLAGERGLEGAQAR